ncbi:Crp/Fnr family transcriptional regulator [Dactylosporangium sp. NPDC049742]|uniref:Crp/Fnr family transcriptional regulator n=1 Tax=Dactylosporangium sp. NPDC049742 TaxID=3154737 RepID=UPI00343E8C2C
MGSVGRGDGPWAATTFLGRLDDRDRRDLLAAGVRRSFPPGRRLLAEGDDSRHIELIERGFVKITTVSADLADVVLAIRGPGDIVGELAAISGNQRSATATTCGRVVSVAVRRLEFEAFLAAHPAAAARLTQAVGEKLLWANRRRSDFAGCPATVRVARVLFELIPICGRPHGDGVRIGISLTQPELASMIGGKESTVHKALRELRAAGIIATGYSEITVIDPGQLDKLRNFEEPGFPPDP